MNNYIYKPILLLMLFFSAFNEAFAIDTKSLYTNTVHAVVSLMADTPNGQCIGTGFYALSPDIIVTCYHVIEGATNVIAKNEGGNYIKIIGIIDYSEKLDIAILKGTNPDITKRFKSVTELCDFVKKIRLDKIK